MILFRADTHVGMSFTEESFFTDHCLKRHNKNFSIIRSWNRVAENGNIDIEHPIYHLRVSRNDGGIIGERLLIYNDSEYIMYNIEKICPEFWAQLEAEQAKVAE